MGGIVGGAFICDPLIRASVHLSSFSFLIFSSFSSAAIRARFAAPEVAYWATMPVMPPNTKINRKIAILFISSLLCHRVPLLPSLFMFGEKSRLHSLILGQDFKVCLRGVAKGAATKWSIDIAVPGAIGRKYSLSCGNCHRAFTGECQE
jgi:hypothetical protein